MSKHTTGELIPHQQLHDIETEEVSLHFIPVMKGGTPVYYCIINDDISEEEARSNAKLTAAGSDMLTELNVLKRELNLIGTMLSEGKTPSDEYISNLFYNTSKVIKKATD